jgi:hypothetical protein
MFLLEVLGNAAWKTLKKKKRYFFKEKLLHFTCMRISKKSPKKIKVQRLYIILTTLATYLQSIFNIYHIYIYEK